MHTKYIHIFFALLLVSSLSFSQDNSKTVHEIRQKVATINTTKFPVIRKIDDAEAFLGHASDNGGELVGYIKNDTIYKIHESVGLSYGFVNVDYYLERDTMIFAYLVEKQFGLQNDGTVDLSKQKTTFEGRYYCSNGRLIKQIETGAKTVSDYKLPLTLIDDAKKYVAILKRKNR